MESSSAPDTALLRDAVPEQKDRMRILAVLGDKTMGQVEGLNLTLASLDARVVDATLPLLATFDGVQQSLPSKAVMDSVDLLDLPGYFASIGVEHLLGHQVVAFLSCVLLSVLEERRLGWCRLVGFTIDSDMLEVASRLWDVHTLKAACEWDSSGGYEDRENVVEVGGCRIYVVWCLFFLSCRFPVILSLCCLQVVLGILWGTKAFVMDDGGEVRRRRGKLDAADATYLRCLMRRYGWEKFDKEVEVCYWSECFPSARYGNKKCLHFAWFLLTRLLHPRNTPALQAMRSLHDPVTVRELRDSRTGVISVSLLYVLYSFLISMVVVDVVVVEVFFGFCGFELWHHGIVRTGVEFPRW